MRGNVDFRKVFQSVDFSQHEAIGDVLYDRQTYVSATTLTLQFFTAVRNNLRDGNIQIASQLSSGQHFLVQSIRVVPIARPDQRAALTAANEGPLLSRVDDLAQLFNDGVFTLRILNKQYAQYPLFLLLPGTGPVSNQTGLTTTAQASNYGVIGTWGVADNRAVYTLAQPIAIPPLTTIRAQMDWAAALTLEAGDLGLELVLDGQTIRPKQ
jgi:hypothetical protein